MQDKKNELMLFKGKILFHCIFLFRLGCFFLGFFLVVAKMYCILNFQQAVIIKVSMSDPQH